jgi:fused signal recognition particle receptor
MRIFSKTIDKLKGALRRTATVLTTDVRTLFIPGRQIDDAFLIELEERLIRADIGVANAAAIVPTVRDRWRQGLVRNADDALGIIREQLLARLDKGDDDLHFAPAGPTVVLVAGVNGAGKTTSIAKLAWLLKEQLGKSVMVCASDTFRAAAVDQLSIWSQRLGVEIVKHKTGADPGAVAYDACEAAKARNIDVLLVDTAGRLHTQDHLMRELTKIKNVVAGRIPGAPHEVLLVLDATTGQNAIQQAKQFAAAVSVSGIVLAKLDGSAKGGAIFSIRDQLGIPVKFIGLGETPQDIESFDSQRFIDALLGPAPSGAAAPADTPPTAPARA